MGRSARPGEGHAHPSQDRLAAQARVVPRRLLPQVYAQGALRADREGWVAQARKASLDAALRALRALGIHPNESGSGLLLRIDAARYVGGIVVHESDECRPPRVLPREPEEEQAGSVGHPTSMDDPVIRSLDPGDIDPGEIGSISRSPRRSRRRLVRFRLRTGRAALRPSSTALAASRRSAEVSSRLIR